MPATYQINKNKSWVEMKLSGQLTVEELTDFRSRLQADPAYSDDLSGIIDCREMTNVLNLPDVRSFADEVNHRPGPPWRSKRAVIVSSPAQYSITRVFMVFAESSPIQYDVFYNPETAMQWLKE
jgi:hypothetical protein